MASLKLLFTGIANSEKYEMQQDTLKKEYERLLAIHESEELKEFNELNEKINSAEFKQKVKEIKSQKFADTEEYKIEKEFTTLLKSKSIKTYLKLEGSEPLNRFNKIAESDELKTYKELKEFLVSEEYKSVKAFMKLSGTKKFEKSEEFASYTEYNQLSKRADIKNYQKFISSPAYNDFKKILESDTLQEIEALEEETKSDGFKAEIKGLKSNQYKNSEQEKLVKRYEQLKKSVGNKAYLKITSMPEFEGYTEIEGSETALRYNELRPLLISDAFKQKIKSYTKEELEQSEEYAQQQEYHQLKQDAKLLAYIKIINHKLFSSFSGFKDSDEFGELETLKTEIESDEFKEQLNDLKSNIYPGSEHEAKVNRLKELTSSAEHKNYLKLKKSKLYTSYEQLDGSDDIEKYNELKTLVESDAFISKKKEIESQKFTDTEAYKKEQEYKRLAQSDDIKFYYKFEKSGDYKIYKEVDGSELLEKYNTLKETFESDEFKKVKEYMLLKPQQKYEQSDEFKEEKRYLELKGNDSIIWYQKNYSHKRFNWFRQWGLSFEDNFDDKKINKDVWMNRYFWGDAVINDSYSLQNELHCFKPENISISSSHAKIQLKNETCEGKKWMMPMGFIPESFDYSSGLLSTGKSFRQQFGVFEAKIKFSSFDEVNNAFWMVGDQMLPHINIVKASKKVMFGCFGENDNQNSKGNHTSINPSKLTQGFNIYRLEWTANSLVWRVNGTEVYSVKNNIPQEAMYLIFSSHLYNDANGANLPAEMEIDWVRCYQHKTES